MATIAVTVLLDADQFEEDGATQHFMETLGGKRAAVKVDGHTLSGMVEAMAVR